MKPSSPTSSTSTTSPADVPAASLATPTVAAIADGAHSRGISRRVSRTLAVACVLALIALGLAWELWLAPTGRGTWAVKVLPLALPLGGLLAARLYSYRVMSLLVWLYVAEGLVRATSDTGVVVPLAIAQTVLAVLLFVACVAFIRARPSPSA